MCAELRDMQSANSKPGQIDETFEKHGRRHRTLEKVYRPTVHNVKSGHPFTFRSGEIGSSVSRANSGTRTMPAHSI